MSEPVTRAQIERSLWKVETLEREGGGWVYTESCAECPRLCRIVRTSGAEPDVYWVNGRWSTTDLNAAVAWLNDPQKSAVPA